MLDKYVADKDIASIQSRIATIQSKAVQMEQADADIRRKCYEWGGVHIHSWRSNAQPWFKEYLGENVGVGR